MPGITDIEVLHSALSEIDMAALEPKAYLVSIVEVSQANRIRCQADGCGHSVFKRIHVVLVKGKFQVLGSQCFTKLYGGMGTSAAVPYYGGIGARPLTDDERAMLVENTARFIEQLENERIEFERVAAIREAERQQEERDRISARQRHVALSTEFIDNSGSSNDAVNDCSKYDLDPSFASGQYRYIWSSSWWNSSGALFGQVRAVLSRPAQVDVIYKAIVETVRQPAISPVMFAIRLENAGVPHDVTLQCLCDLKLAVRGKMS